MKVVHEKEKCIGCGACVAVCAKQWEMGNDGKSNLIAGKLNPQTNNFELETDKVECSQAAADGCPVQCIHIES